MERYSIREAQDDLYRLIADARQGKTVLIVGEDDVMVQLVPVALAKPQNRQAGSARGLIKMAPDFDAPLDDFREYME